MELDQKIIEALDGYHQKTADGLADLSTRLGDLEAKAARPGMPGVEHAEMAEAKKAMATFLRTGDASELESRAAEVGTDASGGYGVPEVLGNELIQRAVNASPMMGLVRVTRVSSSDYKRVLSVRGSSSGWADETDTRSETSTPTLAIRTPTSGELYAYPKSSNWLLEDFAFDAADWLIGEAGDEMGVQLDSAILTGNGTNKPTGILNSAPVTTDDDASPARAEGVLEYIPTGEAAAFPNDAATSPAGSPGDILYNCVYTLRAPYRSNARWVMNSATAGVIRKWKDADGRYLWNDSLIAGQPNLLCGYGVTVDEGMPDIAADALPVLFGDFQKLYEAVIISDTRITRDEVTTPGYTKFYIRQRAGGIMLDSHAAKVIKVAAS